MEKYTMFMDQKNQYSENEYTTQSNLQIQCNPYQATSNIFHRTRTNNFKICMEIQKTLNSQSNLEKEEWNWRNQLAWLQALLHSHSHQDSMVLAQSEKYRSVEQNRKPRDKSSSLFYIVWSEKLSKWNLLIGMCKLCKDWHRSEFDNSQTTDRPIWCNCKVSQRDVC